MRINIFEQISSFYSFIYANQDKSIKPQHIALYMFLLNQNNRNMWVEWFKCPFDTASAGSCISSKKTYYNCLSDLQKWNLIEYKPGINNWKAPLIKIEVLKVTSTVPQSEPQPIPQLTSQELPQPTPNIIQDTKDNNTIDSNSVILSNDYKHSKVLEFWNSLNIIKHKSLSKKSITIIDKELKNDGGIEFQKICKRYSKVLNDENFFFDYKWTLEEFLTRKGGYDDFKDDGSKWVNYKETTKQEKTKNKIDPKLLEQLRATGGILTHNNQR